MRGGCGSEVVLETVNAARAFLTTDSGFPVNKLEEALRTNRPFTYDFHPASASRCCSARNTGRPAEGKETQRFHRSASSAIRRYAGCTWGFPSWTAKPPRRCARAVSLQRTESVRARARFLRRHVRDPRRQGGGSGRGALGSGVGGTGGRLAGKGRGILREADGEGRRLAGQPVRRPGAHQRPGAGLSDRPGAHEALLQRRARADHQSGTGAAGVPLQHRHDAADHAAASWTPTASRTFPAAWRSGRTCSRTARRASTTAS